MPCRAIQDKRVMVESSDKMWPTGEGNGKPIQHSCVENPMNSMKKQKEYRSGLLFPPPGDLLCPGIEPASPVAPALGHILYH